MIQLKNISLTFKPGTPLENRALKKINLNIAAGDFITVIGSNGAGKSTLLHILAGSLLPSHGNIFFDNIKVTQLAVEQRAKWVSHVYQDPCLGTCENLTIAENLAFALNRGKARGLSLALNQPIREHFRATLRDLNMGLENRLNERVMMLSGGQRQALSLVMATLQPPKILLLDEHTAALDPKTANMVLDITQRLIKQHHLTTFMVTHNMGHALALGNRTLLMREGEVIEDLTQKQRQKLTTMELMQYF